MNCAFQPLRFLVPLALCLPFACPAQVSIQPIEVVIIGVPGVPGVQAYLKSPLGDEISSTCNDLKKLFEGHDAVHVTTLCSKEKTTYHHVDDFLKVFFSSQLGSLADRRLSIVFIMTHGEIANNNDVQLMMSDTTDDDKDTSSLRIKELFGILGGSNRRIILFLDSCYSGQDSGLEGHIEDAVRQTSGGITTAIASTGPDQQAINLSFTKALIDTWKNMKKEPCLTNPDDFLSAIETEMNKTSVTSVPRYLTTQKESLCFSDLISPDKRVISLWRDPKSGLAVDLYSRDSRGQDVGRPLASIPVDQYAEVPRIGFYPPGSFHIKTAPPGSSTSTNEAFPTFHKGQGQGEPSYFAYEYPSRSRDDIDRLRNRVDTYEAVNALGSNQEELANLAAQTALIYTRIPPNERDRAEIVLASSLELRSAVHKYIQRPSGLFSPFVSKINDKNVQGQLEAGFTDLIAANPHAVTEIDQAAKLLRLSSSVQFSDNTASRVADSLRLAARSIANKDSSVRTLSYIDSAVDSLNAVCGEEIPCYDSVAASDMAQPTSSAKGNRSTIEYMN